MTGIGDRPLVADACRCRLSTTCATCCAWRAVFDAVASRRAEADERAIEDRRSRAVRLPLDLDALADAVARRRSRLA